MKKISILLIALLLLAACSTDKVSDKEEVSDEQGLEVKKGLTNVELTIPTMLLEGEDIETVIAQAKESGVKEVTKNEDGSLTYKMSKSDHKEMLKEMKQGIEEQVAEIESSEDFATIQKITYKKDFSEYTVQVNKADFENSLDGFAVFALGFTGMFYQVTEGKEIEKINITINLEDVESGEVFESFSFPEVLESESEGE